MNSAEASAREDAAFAGLRRAVEHRGRIDAKMAVYDDHWEGYKAALDDMEQALRAYEAALRGLRQARAQLVDP